MSFVSFMTLYLPSKRVSCPACSAVWACITLPRTLSPLLLSHSRDQLDIPGLLDYSIPVFSETGRTSFDPTLRATAGACFSVEVWTRDLRHVDPGTYYTATRQGYSVDPE